MSTEPMTTTAPTADSSERGLLIGLLMLVLLGVGAMLFMG
ncbi:hypothetical protein GCM10010435_02770 [Winogradskya consettensis]|uniref:Uncharacterized protein n=1 Tax=Winogradskya consettensis TaxID=113560 RepID=A0A919S754_9ACTN|nr:hypothetical protein Aco04nite_00180 [Actinoplanes consettensis]